MRTIKLPTTPIFMCKIQQTELDEPGFCHVTHVVEHDISDEALSERLEKERLSFEKQNKAHNLKEDIKKALTAVTNRNPTK